MKLGIYLYQKKELSVEKDVEEKWYSSSRRVKIFTLQCDIIANKIGWIEGHKHQMNYKQDE